MFFSKIWLFLLTLAATLAVTVALLLPRPVQHAHEQGEQQRLAVGCGVVNVLLADNARRRVDFVRRFGRAPELVSALAGASGVDAIDERRNSSAREVGNRLIASSRGDAPDFAMLIDARGRVLARVGRGDKDYGDVAAGRPLVDDALAGLVRDDVWVMDNTVFLVAAAPVISTNPMEYVGAVVLGYRFTADLARRFTEWSRGDTKDPRFHVDLAVFLGTDLMASTSPVALDPAPMVEVVAGAADKEVGRDCLLNKPIPLKAGKAQYLAVMARLPGEAQQRQAYFTVFIQQPHSLGLLGWIKAVRRDDLSPGSFPWALVGGGFALVLLAGLALAVFEADRPLRRLVNDAARLARGGSERLGEDHPGRFGSVARNVNIQIDRVARAAKTAKQDLDQLLGPAPQGSLGTIDLLAGVTSSPSIAPAPSEFRFSDPPKPAAASAREPLDLSRPPPGMSPAAGPPVQARPKPPVPRAPTPPPLPVAAPSPLRLDEDILGSVPTAGAPAAVSAPISTSGPAVVAGASSRSSPGSTPPPGFDGSSETYFREVYAQFIAAKQACGEPTAGVTFEKFAEKLRKNRDELMSRTACRDVTFTVYVKEGKAALKASPVRG